MINSRNRSAGKLIRLELENFKSYAGTQTIGPFHDFTAVIGPNGAGKSNLMDAISFVLGVNSKQLRSQRMEDLIFRCDEDNIKIKRAMVKLVYYVGSDGIPDVEVGDEIHFSRIILSSGVSSYRLNNKEVSWKVYEKRLDDIGVIVKARNFLVFQGDVESIASTSAVGLTKFFEKVEYDNYKKLMESAEQETIHSMQQKRSNAAERKIFKEQKEEAERFESKMKRLQDLKREYFLTQLFYLDREIFENEKNLEMMTAELDEKQNEEKEAEKIVKQQKRELTIAQKNLSKLEASAEKTRFDLAELGPSGIKLKEEIRTVGRQIERLEQSIHDLKNQEHQHERVIEKIELEISESIQKEEDIMKQIKDYEMNNQANQDYMKEYEFLKSEFRKMLQEKGDLLQEHHRKNAAINSKLEAADSEKKVLVQKLSDVREMIQQYNDRKSATTAALNASEDERKKLENELKSITEIEEHSKTELDGLERDLIKAEAQLREARNGVRASTQEEKMAELIAALGRNFYGVRGRLGSLFKPSHKRFSTALATAIGKHIDSIVVDSKQTAFDCIKHLRMHRLGTASFIPLDSIKTSQIAERYRTFGSNFRLAIDIIQCDLDIKSAVAYAVGNTIISDSLDDARYLCYSKGEKVKCVTLQGAIISKSGLMTGGTGSQESRPSHTWTEQKISELKIERETIRNKIVALKRLQYQQTTTAEIKTKLKGLLNRSSYSRADMQVCDEKIHSLMKQESVLISALDDCRLNIEKINSLPDDIKLKMEKLELEVQKTENAVFRDFFKKVGVKSVHEFEEGPLSICSNLNKERLRIVQHRASLEAQLEYEHSKDFSKLIEKTLKKISNRNKIIFEASNRLVDIKKQEENFLKKMEHLEKDILKEKNEIIKKEREVRSVMSKHHSFSKEKEKIGKKLTVEETNIEHLRAKLHEVLQRAQVEEADLPVKYSPILEENVANDAASQADLLREVQSQSQGVSTAPHFSQSDNITVLRDRRLAHNIDLSKLEKNTQLNDSSELQEVLENFAKQIASLKNEVERMRPNMKARDQFNSALEKLKESGVLFEAAKSKSRNASQAFYEVKHKRRECFEDAFQHISEALSTIYKELTRSSKHPLGGQASITIDDPEEPYNGGIKFRAMPPGKRLRDMDQLSGGERTVGALALLFAIHSYRPAPFFVMDEIDAALDNINVKKVCNFLESRAAESIFQTIVISLKDMFYERADALVGIYRDASTNSSRTATLDLSEFVQNDV